MLERNAYARLLKWKNEMPNKALLVDGARQIGKTYLIEAFASREFADVVKVDFIRDEQAPFIAQAADAQDLVQRLSLMAGHAVTPAETLVFFDEVQEAQNLVTLSKYLVQDARFRLVMSGSLLGTELKHVRSFPVGFLHVETMFPLSFEEFARALGVAPQLWDSMRGHFECREPLEESLHERLIRLFRLYVVVGGMPEAVQRYLNTGGDLGAVRDTQLDLYQLYRADISRYAGQRILQVMAIYDGIPSQLDKENKRFELKSLRGKATFERYANDFQWLVSARAALKTPNVTEPKSPLKRTEENGRFKLYLGDVGMLTARYPLSSAMAVIAGEKSVNFGSVYENVVAQELAAAHVALRYHRHSGRGEVDFIGETPSRSVLPIEVKSGKTYKRHVALNNLLSNEEFAVERGVVLSEANISVGERAGKPVQYLPLYFVPFLAQSLLAEEVSAEEELARLGAEAESLIVQAPDFSDFG